MKRKSFVIILVAGHLLPVVIFTMLPADSPVRALLRRRKDSPNSTQTAPAQQPANTLSASDANAAVPDSIQQLRQQVVERMQAAKPTQPEPNSMTAALAPQPGAAPNQAPPELATTTTTAQTEPQQLGAAEAQAAPAEPNSKTQMKALARLNREQLVRQKYQPLFEKLPLSDADQARLSKMLLLKPQFRGQTSAHLPLANPGAGAGTANPIPTSAAALESAILDLLGAQHYKTYQDYEASLPGRWLVQQSKQQLQAHGEPLNPTQEEQLLATIVQAHQSLPAVSAVAARQNLAAIPEKMAQNLDHKQDANQAILQQASHFLNSNQLTALRALLDQGVAQERLSLQVYRQLFQQNETAVPVK